VGVELFDINAFSDIKNILVAHDAKKIAYVVIYPSLAEAAADAAHERTLIVKDHGV
jgi:hypothetical protein